MPAGNKLAFKYDDFSRLIEETDPLGRQIRYKHHLGTTLVTETAFSDGSVWKLRYDDKGNLIAEVDAIGHKTDYLNAAKPTSTSSSVCSKKKGCFTTSSTPPKATP